MISQVETNLLLKMAQQAGRDSSLVACQIEAMARKQPGGWTGVAEALHLDETRLARLALCRCPQEPNFDSEVRQICELVGAEPAVLQKLFSSTRPQAPGSSRLPARPAATAPRRFGPWMWAGGLALMVLVVLAGWLVLGGASPQSQATLVIEQGQAQVRTGPSALAWLTAPREQAVAAGQMLVVKAGDQIRLNPGASGQVRFYDGTLVELVDQAELTIQTLNTTPDSYQIQLQQLGGVTLSRVRRLLGAKDFFQIRTPSSTVSVRGTEFIVQVISPESSRVLVSKGLVHVAAGSQEVDVRPGEQTLVVRGQPLQVFDQKVPLPVPVPPIHLPGEVPGPLDPQTVPPDVSSSNAPSGEVAPSVSGAEASPAGGSVGQPANGDTPGNSPSAPPGQVKVPPGQVKEPPGQVKEPPGQVNEPPGQANEPPGQVKEPPGQIKEPPGQIKEPPGKVK